MSILHHLGLVATALAISLGMTPLARRLGFALGAVDRPGGRRVHQGHVPRIGGVAIVAGVLGALAVQWLGETHLGWESVVGRAGERYSLIGVVSGLGLIFAVGLIDDLVGLRAGAKLAGQTVAALAVAAAGLRITYVGNPFSEGLVMLGVLSVPVTIVYLVGFANVINLIDGLDGLAAGVSAIAAVSLSVLAVQGNRLDAAVLSAAVVGACLGFLVFNFNPASIFMGDSGSMFLGFTLATISLLGVMKTTATIALAVPLIVIGVPVFDTASAIVRRLYHGRPIHQADRGHIHHRLLGRGFDQRQTVLIIYAWSAALGAAAYAVRYAPGYIRSIALIGLLGITALMAYWLGLFEAAHHHDEEDPGA